MMGETPGAGALWSLVQALQGVSCLSDPNSRRLVLRLLSDELGYLLPVNEYSQTNLHLLAIVDSCRQRPDGLLVLLGVLESVEPGTIALTEVRQIILDLTSLQAWTAEERHQLFGLLSGVTASDVTDIYAHVAGTGAPPLPPEASLEQAFLLLETLNCGPDGVPKSLMLVEHVAARLRFDLAAEIRGWVDEKARRMDLVKELEGFRNQIKGVARLVDPPKPRSEAYLVFLLQPDGPTGDGYLLSHWRQLDVSSGWYPERGPDFFGGFDEVRRKVAELAEKVEGEWAPYDPDIRLDFILSRDLLHLDVDQWQWEVETSIPEPLGCHFPMGVRSLERMKARKWHRAWYVRWKELKAQAGGGGPIALESGFWSPRDEARNLRELTAWFEAKPDLVAFVLSEPPRPFTVESDEIAVGLRAGFPVMVWHREDCRSEEFSHTVKELLHAEDPHHLLERLRLIRLSAFAEGPEGSHVGSRLAILWDDPERMVVPQRPTAPEAVSSV
ncbi:VMAP-C domain-containing protein [Amycolatopsis sp. NBC_01286]|uniref:VMAP-C domain-containing protein n=1 Tax=Amycolatopsis sp. NBC_01286 TaxID=2903560 RepID=UPI002E150DFB|nr:hypothetical protein OG570_19410 [Amycolatopsis sp. NBC_01286]